MSELKSASNRELAASEVLYAIDSTIFGDADAHFNEDGEERSFEILELMCDAYSDTHSMTGDLGSSGAPLDPLFWPTHPTVERLWHWRRLNGFDDESWPDDAKHTYFHDVYDKNGTASAGGECYGHGPNDVMIWRNLFDQDDTYYTNLELYDNLSPASSTLPYVYDNFRWSHCAEEGYSEDLLGLSESETGSDDLQNGEKHDRFDHRQKNSSSPADLAHTGDSEDMSSDKGDAADQAAFAVTVDR